MNTSDSSKGFMRGRSVVVFGALVWLIVIAVDFGSHALNYPDIVDAIAHYEFRLSSLRMWAWIVIASILLSPFAKLFSKREDAAAQQKRDDDAAQILSDLKSGVHRKFSLYLRSFWLTSRVPARYTENASQHFNYPDRDFEYVLTSAMHTSAPLVGLGRHGETPGAGLVELPDSEWMDQVRILARAAKIIFVIPLNSTWTHWEMEFLRDEHLLSKAIFLMPPDGHWFRESELAKKWNESRDFYATKNFELPPYWTEGRLFRLDDAGRLLTIGEYMRDTEIVSPEAIPLQVVPEKLSLQIEQHFGWSTLAARAVTRKPESRASYAKEAVIALICTALCGFVAVVCFAKPPQGVPRTGMQLLIGAVMSLIGIVTLVVSVGLAVQAISFSPSSSESEKS